MLRDEDCEKDFGRFGLLEAKANGDKSDQSNAYGNV